MNFITNLFCAAFMFIAGAMNVALNISQAIDAFQKQHYFLFGLHIMLSILFAAFTIKYYFNAIGD